MKLSIIVPVYNEEGLVKKAIENVKKLKIDKEIIVVDDGSTDNSLNNILDVEGVKICRHKINKGKGAAFKTGLSHATGDIIIVYDADCEYDANDIPKCIQPIIDGKAEVVYGSRRLKKQKQHSGFSFYLGGIGLTFATNMLYYYLGPWRSYLTDEPTCYKTFKRHIIDFFKIEGNGFEWEPEITARIIKAGRKIHEVPISYYPRHKDEGKKINWRDGFIALWTLIKWRFK